MLEWCPQGSDPGLCVTETISEPIIDWGQRCQRELVTQSEACRIAAESNAYLEGLGGSRDGIIGALAAVGLMATANDGRVIHLGSAEDDLFEISGMQSADFIYSRGVGEIRCLESGAIIRSGLIDVGKRLRPNYRNRKVVLYATPAMFGFWQAIRVT